MSLFHPRQSRRPLLAGLALALLLSSLLGLLALRSRPTRPPAAAESTPTAPSAADEIVLTPARIDHATLGRGGTLAAALERLEVPVALRPTLIEAIAESVDPRRLPPETGLTSSRDGAGGLLGIAVRHSPERFLRITLEPPGEPALRTELAELPVGVRVESTGGVVDSSVAQALADSPHGIELTSAFADVFQWDVDLLIEPRAGDIVCIVFETLLLGALPDDLPRFGERVDRPGDVLRIGRILAASYSGSIAAANAFWIAGGAAGDPPGDYFDADGLPLRKAFLKSPLSYSRISSRFSNSRRHPVTRKVVPHHGVDFAAAPGTPVVATADGRVVSAGWSGALGRAVQIRHGSEYTTIYGHLRGFARGVRAGTEVRQNQVIGYVGSTGRATGPHLHYTVQKRGRSIDPLRMENPPVAPLDPAMQPSLADAVRRYGPRLGSIADRLAARVADGGVLADSVDSVRSGT